MVWTSNTLNWTLLPLTGRGPAPADVICTVLDFSSTPAGPRVRGSDSVVLGVPTEVTLRTKQNKTKTNLKLNSLCTRVV